MQPLNHGAWSCNRPPTGRTVQFSAISISVALQTQVRSEAVSIVAIHQPTLVRRQRANVLGLESATRMCLAKLGRRSLVHCDCRAPGGSTNSFLGGHPTNSGPVLSKRLTFAGSIWPRRGESGWIIG